MRTAQERNNATNQVVTDYSHEERLCDSTVIENKARRRHIVMTAMRSGVRDRPRTIAMTTTNTRHCEREAVSMIPRSGAREVTLRGRQKPAYDATNRENRVLLKRHDLFYGEQTWKDRDLWSGEKGGMRGAGRCVEGRGRRNESERETERESACERVRKARERKNGSM